MNPIPVHDLGLHQGFDVLKSLAVLTQKMHRGRIYTLEVFREAPAETLRDTRINPQPPNAPWGKKHRFNPSNPLRGRKS